MATIIKNTIAVTQDTRRHTLPRASILIEDGVIQKISSAPIKKRIGDNVIDASHFILFPGLVNAHVHLGESIYKSLLACNLDLRGYLKATENIAKKSALVEQGRRVVSDYSSMLLIKHGTTTVCGGRTAETAERLGLRNVSGYMAMKSFKLGKYYPHLERQFMDEYSRISSLRVSKPAIFIHSLNSVESKKIREIAGLLKRYSDVKLIVHLSETRHDERMVRQRFGASSTRVLQRYGLLGKNTLVVHGNWLTASDLALIKKAGTAIVHCLSSNLRIDDKTLDLKKTLAIGVPVCLGTDGLATSGSLDILAEAKLVYAYHNRFGSGTIAPHQIFDMITIHAARALGMGREIGSIEAGKKADFIFVDQRHPLIDTTDPVKSLVLYAEPSMISGAMIDGKMKLWNGNFRGETALVKNFHNLEQQIRKQIR